MSLLDRALAKAYERRRHQPAKPMPHGTAAATYDTVVADLERAEQLAAELSRFYASEDIALQQPHVSEISVQRWQQTYADRADQQISDDVVEPEVSDVVEPHGLPNPSQPLDESWTTETPSAHWDTPATETVSTAAPNFGDTNFDAADFDAVNLDSVEFDGVDTAVIDAGDSVAEIAQPSNAAQEVTAGTHVTDQTDHSLASRLAGFDRPSSTAEVADTASSVSDLETRADESLERDALDCDACRSEAHKLDALESDVSDRETFEHDAIGQASCGTDARSQIADQPFENGFDSGDERLISKESSIRFELEQQHPDQDGFEQRFDEPDDRDIDVELPCGVDHAARLTDVDSELSPRSPDAPHHAEPVTPAAPIASARPVTDVPADATVPLETGPEPIAGPEPVAAAAVDCPVEGQLNTTAAAKPHTADLTWHWPEICEQLDQFTGDGFRQLAKHLQFAAAQGNKVLAFVGSTPNTGRSSVVLTLTRILALEGRTHVLLVDADHQHPDLAQVTRLPGDLGIGDLIDGQQTWNQITLTPAPGLVTLAPLRKPITRSDWPQLVAPLQQSLRQARDQFDLILIDAGVFGMDTKLSECWLRGTADAVITISRQRSDSQTAHDVLNWKQIGIESLGVIETFA